MKTMNKYLEKIAGFMGQSTDSGDTTQDMTASAWAGLDKQAALSKSLIGAGIGAGVGALAPADDGNSRLAHTIMGGAAGGLVGKRLDTVARDNKIKNVIKGTIAAGVVGGFGGREVLKHMARKATSREADATVGKAMQAAKDISFEDNLATARATIAKRNAEKQALKDISFEDDLRTATRDIIARRNAKKQALKDNTPGYYTDIL